MEPGARATGGRRQGEPAGPAGPRRLRAVARQHGAAVPEVRGRAARGGDPGAHGGDRGGGAGAALRGRQRRLPAAVDRQGGVADRGDHGRHPRAECAGEVARERRGGAHHER